VELLAKEEDTVSVGQDLFIIEPGEGGGKPHVTYETRYFSRFHTALASAAPEEPKTDPEEPKDQQLDKTTPEPRAPSAAEKQSGSIPPEGPKESKKEVKKQESKPKEDKSKAPPPAPKVPGNRGETRVSSISMPALSMLTCFVP
jgi:2-oxoglutarate dehydrogenase E2 component (dihydrolipoamide succinyltransferase)